MIARERILLGLFLTGLGGYGAYWGYETQIADRIDGKTRAVERARQTATGKRRELIESRAAKLELEQWQKLSLPPDPNVAVPQYQALLLDLLQQCGFDDLTITPGTASLREDSYWRMPFDVQGRGSLAALVTFLDAFHRIQLLHKLTQLSMTPIEANRQESLELRFAIEALALASDAAAGADGSAATASAGAPSAPRNPWADVLDRNLLMRQGPGPAARPAYQAAQVYVTGTIVRAGQPEALFYNRATGESMNGRVGDHITAGEVQAELIDITTTEIVLAIDGQWYTVALGQPLSGRTRLTPQQALAREMRSRPDGLRAN